MLVCFASIMHILWGTLLLINMGALHITATSTLYALVGEGHYVLRAWMLIIAGVLPVILAIRPTWSLTGLVLCAPQLFLLVLSGISAVTAIADGSYSDGTVRSWLFIAMDQGIYLILPLMYAFETLDRFHDRTAATVAPKEIHERTTRVP